MNHWAERRWIARTGRDALRVGSISLLAFVLTYLAVSRADAATIWQNRSAAPSTVVSVWYVSRMGDNTTGASWAHAWNELNQIRWRLVQPGDIVEIDGGSVSCPSPFNAATTTPYDFPTPKPGTNCGMLYNTTLTVRASGTSAAPITVALSKEPGRIGTAVIFGGRTSSLPACTVPSYTASWGGANLAAGIVVSGRTYVTIDGTKRSGIVVYGAQSGVDLANNPSFVTLQNLELFDNGVWWKNARGLISDNPGIWMTGHDLIFARNLIHDNGQDAIQDNILSAGQFDVTISDSWLYQSRENPLQPGWGFNQSDHQTCQHVDGIQTWNGGTSQHDLTIQNSIIGPYIGQAIYPADSAGASWNQVSVSNTLLLAYYDGFNSNGLTTADDTFTSVTGYHAASAPDGTTGNSFIDGLRGAGHTLSNSIYVGQTNDRADQITGSGNIYSKNDTSIAGAVRTNLRFARALSVQRPHWSDWQALNLLPICAACAGKGSTIHTFQDILNRIDALNDGWGR